MFESASLLVCKSAGLQVCKSAGLQVCKSAVCVCRTPTDKGSEFISKHFKDFLKREGIKLYHTENEEKSSVVERWNKTMKNRM